MVAAYVSAGYEKIHIDTSMGAKVSGPPARLGNCRAAARLAVIAAATAD